MASLRQHAAFLSLALRRGLATTTAAPGAAAAAAAAQAVPAAATAESGGARGRIYAACVLERLPIVKSPPPSWEVEHEAWRQERRLASGQLKRYPQLGDARQRAADGGGGGGGAGDAAAAADGGGGEAAASEAPSPDAPATFETPADARGDVRTMKRRLNDKLVLLVKGGGNSASSPRWRFPSAEHRAGETIRATAERALREAIGLPPLFFVGNAPMAHLEEEEGEEKPAIKTTFFHLAQVLNDPWEVELAAAAARGKKGAGGGGGESAGGAAAAVDYAWVAPDELDKYLGAGGGAEGEGAGGTALLDLTRRML